MSRAVLGIDNGSFFYGATRVFENVSFQLDDARTALVGDNGAGKSTLLKCLMGELDLQGGAVVKSRGLYIGYVPQEIPPEYKGKTLRQVLESELPETDGSEDWKVDVMLDDVGIAPDKAELPFTTLSGGWQRLMLIAAAAKLKEPNLLILDEPTNHLDIANINTLERWISEDWRMPMLIVSHDREFLNRMTDRTVFLRSDGAQAFKTTFSLAREALIERDVANAKQRALEEKEVDRLKKMAARYKAWGVLNSNFHKRMKSTEKRIDRLQADRTDSYVARKRDLSLHDGEIDAKIALRIENFDVTIPDGSRKLFRIDKLVVGRGDRIAILGVNGAGKSMLLGALERAFAKQSAHYDGGAAIRFNPGAKLVYFDQRMQALPVNTSLLDYLSSAQRADTGVIAQLAKAGFPFARLKSPIRELSYGERSRLMFLKMRFDKPNFYLLDEPTNHLDIEGQEDLEEQLEGADVTCLFVSHDRFFTRTAATRFVEIRKGKLVEVEGPEDFFESQVE
ncbi:MAG: ABC-F family ATP-binding cassette domain-containing protein [Caulobacterales bacterium]